MSKHTASLDWRSDGMTLYRYGWLAWVWRVLAFVGIAASLFLVVLAVRTGTPILAAVALPLAVPATLVPWMLAVRIERPDERTLEVTNLFGVRRRLRTDELGTPRVRLTAQGTDDHIAAPRAWVPVKGGLPVYLDLMAEIPDRARLLDAFGLPGDL